jgi:DNA-directed RNA polymerase subunit RPC12/RpoP
MGGRTMTIKCPYCRRNMIPHKDPYPTNNPHEKRKLWNCTHCKRIFQIIEMGWYPLKEIEQE